MLDINTDVNFGICQIGEWNSFCSGHIVSSSMEIFDFSLPFSEILGLLEDIQTLFIVSRFTNAEDITNASVIIDICRNYPVFLIVITPSKNRTNLDLDGIRNKVDIFLNLEDKYFEDVPIDDPVAYAIDFLASAFDILIDKDDLNSWRGSPLYAFSQSGDAELVVFDLPDVDGINPNGFQLPENLLNRVVDKRLAYLRFRSRKSFNIWAREKVVDSIKEASGKMLYTNWHAEWAQRFNLKPWVAAILSEMNNPNNSYTRGTHKTFFQQGQNR